MGTTGLAHMAQGACGQGRHRAELTRHDNLRESMVHFASHYPLVHSKFDASRTSASPSKSTRDRSLARSLTRGASVGRRR